MIFKVRTKAAEDGGTTGEVAMAIREKPLTGFTPAGLNSPLFLRLIRLGGRSDDKEDNNYIYMHTRNTVTARKKQVKAGNATYFLCLL